MQCAHDTEAIQSDEYRNITRRGSTLAMCDQIGLLAPESARISSRFASNSSPRCSCDAEELILTTYIGTTRPHIAGNKVPVIYNAEDTVKPEGTRHHR